jgi:hypothetical protein
VSNRVEKAIDVLGRNIRLQSPCNQSAAPRVSAGNTVVEAHMKTQLAFEANRQAELAAADLALQIKSLFEVCPNLCGFVVEDLSGLHGDPDPNNGDNRFVITQISFSAPLSLGESEQVCGMIAAVVSELVAEQPETYELLRGRTFARTLH